MPNRGIANEPKGKHRLRVSKKIEGTLVKHARCDVLDLSFREAKEKLLKQASLEGLDLEEYFFSIRLEMVPWRELEQNA